MIHFKRTFYIQVHENMQKMKTNYVQWSKNDIIMAVFAFLEKYIYHL